VDTAGIRRALNEAESIGIRKSMEALADADLVLVVLDATQPMSDEDRELLNQVAARPAIIVENKSDLTPTRTHVGADALVRPAERSSAACASTSALTGAGIPELRAEILRHVGGGDSATPEAGFLTSLRHHKLVNDALTALDAANHAVAARVPHEMLLLDLYNALRPLDEITGATTTDDILNLIFGSFCIGK
jgi:tRNA modification GTPase